MDAYTDDFTIGAPEPQAGLVPEDRPPAQDKPQPDDGERKLVERVVKTIKEDKQHFAKAFKRMRRSMQIARRGAPPEWPANAYVANITGRHISQSTAALYAKNPKAIARRRERLDFQVWDETEQSLSMAMQTMQAAVSPVDPVTGMMAPPPDPLQMMAAQELLADFQQGMQTRKTIERVGKTLEILFNYFIREQKPLEFKTAMKQVVRRAETTCAAYVEVGFQREYERDGDVTRNLADARDQIDHIRLLMEKTQSDEEYAGYEANVRELEVSLASLQQQEYLLLREGLVFDFPSSAAVIPDKRCTSLVGFVGCGHVTVEYLYTPDQVRSLFGVDLGKEYTPYSPKGEGADDNGQMRFKLDGYEEGCSDLACVWKCYDRDAGVVYFVCDGHKSFLRPPAPPDVYVEDFWPLYALTFNEVEDPEDIFPPSDVERLYHMQIDHNDARQGKREHRKAARPRYVSWRGALSEEEKEGLESAAPWSVTEINPQGDNPDIGKMLQQVPVSGVDPNLYDTGEIFSDVQVVVGSQEAQFGGVSKATATESSIAEGSRISSNDSKVDDLDSFLTVIARACGTVLLREMSEEMVKRIAGPGAVWPPLTLEEIAGEIYLEIEAGSSGKPNAAAEIANWERMLPFLIQLPTIRPEWLARETLRRLDDRMDLTDAIAESAPAIVAMNRMSVPSPADPGAAPDQQGPEGGANQAPAAPGGPSGTEAAMGNNQV